MVASNLSAQSGQLSPAAVPEPRTIAFCELAKDPGAYNHELIRVTGFVTHGFEDFQLSEPDCSAIPHRFSLWLMYGGKARSNTMYCCPGEGAEQTRRESLIVEGVPIPLLQDSVFGRFTDLLNKEPDTTVRATLVGRFFAGENIHDPEPTWKGFGHLGCCSLLAIQQVETFEPHGRTDVEYTAEGGWYEKEGCDPDSVSYRRHVSMTFDERAAREAIAEQSLADSGARAWAFTDPSRVAAESLAPFYGDRIPALQKVRATTARQVFRWKQAKRFITVVVTRPYWLSFYSSSGSVAWISTTIKEADCP